MPHTQPAEQAVYAEALLEEGHGDAFARSSHDVITTLPTRFSFSHPRCSTSFIELVEHGDYSQELLRL